MSTRFVANSMTDVSRMFLLFSGRYISVPHAEGRQHGVSIQLQSSINMGNTVNENIYLSYKKPLRHESWQECLHIHLLSSLMN